MKINFTKKWMALVVVLPFLVTSCIKEKYKIDYGADNTTRLITEFTDGKNDINTLAIDAATGISVVPLTEIRAVTRSVISKGYTVKISLNNSLITAYNTANGTAFVAPPVSAITLETLDFNLSDQRRSAFVTARINPTSLLGNLYAIGLTITLVGDGEISQVAKNVLIAISVKNAYDADYRSVGTRTSHGGPNNTFPITGTFPYNYIKNLATVDATTCIMQTADNVDDMYIKVNPDNSVTVSTVPGGFATSNEGPCTYNPATRTFTLNYKYFNSSGNYRKMVETLVRQ
ncbi:MAG: DUF4361 domain-containing protein [Bacteroidota bacterium]|nr:DUF4361 domain-containing protein [Bacteroidota bacterium]